MARRKIHVNSDSPDLKLCDDTLPMIPFYNQRTFACIGSVNKEGELVLTVPESINTDTLKAIIVRPKELDAGDLFMPVEFYKVSPLLEE